MNSRDVIRHPGPESRQRVVSARGDVSLLCIRLNAGELLLEAVAHLMDNSGCDTGLIVLDGIDLGPFDYVMPSQSDDDLHAAWYSETHSCRSARLRHGTAIIGKRNDKWWLHCHAVWDTDRQVGIGHLLPDTLRTACDAMVSLYVFNGGRFDVALDPETAFPIFHVHGAARSSGNALIARVCPHEDIHLAIRNLISEAGFNQASIFGIGSLVGAGFADGQTMSCPISEVLVCSGAQWDGSLILPMYCVDIDNQHFYGNIVEGAAPVLVTFELLIVETPANAQPADVFHYSLQV